MRLLAHRAFGRRRPAWLVFGLGACCLASGCALFLTQPNHARGVRDAGVVPPVNSDVSLQNDTTTDGGAAQRAVASAAPSIVQPSPEQVTPMTHPIAQTAAPTPGPTAVPTRIQITRLHIDASVVAVATDSKGALGVPDDPQVTGWWDASAQPGAQTGSVVIDGHVDSAVKGLGAFFALGDVAIGDQIVVTDAAGTSTNYDVAALRRYPKTTLPAADIFAQATSPRLVLVTCGGAFNHDTHSYLDNVVVFAVPA